MTRKLTAYSDAALSSAGPPPAAAEVVGHTPGDTQPGSARFFRTDHLMADLKGRSVRGGAVTLAAQGLKFTLQMGSTMVLARLLSPADFGLVAMVAAVTGFVALFKDAGLSIATVQRDQITHGQVSALFWINVAISIALMAVTACLAPAIAWFYGEPQLIWITLGIAGTFIFSGLTVQHQALLRRQMEFRLLATIDIIAMAVGVAAAIAVGVLTRSYWALVAMPAGTAIATAIGVWIACPWAPGRPHRGTGVMPMLRFGGTLTGFSVINYFSRNVDNVLTGWWLGAAALGFYSKAYSLLLLPINQINAPFSTVMLPALSRLQHDSAAFRKLYLEVMAGIAWLGMPGVTLLALHATAVVTLVLGEQWLPAVPVFQLLAPAALVATTNVAGSWAVIPNGRADKELKLSLVTSPCFVLAICIGLPYGIHGVAIAVSASRVLLKLPALAYCYAGTPLTVTDFLRAIAQPALLCLAIVPLHCLLLAALPALGIAGADLAAFLIELAVVTTAFALSSASRQLWLVLRRR